MAPKKQQLSEIAKLEKIIEDAMKELKKHRDAMKNDVGQKSKKSQKKEEVLEVYPPKKSKKSKNVEIVFEDSPKGIQLSKIDDLYGKVKNKKKKKNQVDPESFPQVYSNGY